MRPVGSADTTVVRVRLTISRKFFAVLAVLTPLTIAVALVGTIGLASLKGDLDRVFSHNAANQPALHEPGG
jgi:hypothetical protein